MAKERLPKGFEIELKQLRMSLIKAEKSINDFVIAYDNCKEEIDELLNKESSLLI